MSLSRATLADLQTIVNITLACYPNLAAKVASGDFNPPEHFRRKLADSDTYVILDSRGGYCILRYDRDGDQTVRFVWAAIDPAAIPSSTTRRTAYRAMLKAIVQALIALPPATTVVMANDDVGGPWDTVFGNAFTRTVGDLRGTPSETPGHNDLVQMSATLAQLGALL